MQTCFIYFTTKCRVSHPAVARKARQKDGSLRQSPRNRSTASTADRRSRFLPLQSIAASVQQEAPAAAGDCDRRHVAQPFGEQVARGVDLVQLGNVRQDREHKLDTRGTQLRIRQRQRAQTRRPTHGVQKRREVPTGVMRSNSYGFQGGEER